MLEKMRVGGCALQVQNGTTEVLEDGDCSGMEKPEEEETCDSGVMCARAEWIASDWSKCEGKCGE